TVT
ncbi:unnamed protein product, partial [Onchocerca ochengi]